MSEYTAKGGEFVAKGGTRFEIVEGGKVRISAVIPVCQSCSHGDHGDFGNRVCCCPCHGGSQFDAERTADARQDVSDWLDAAIRSQGEVIEYLQRVTRLAPEGDAWTALSRGQQLLGELIAAKGK